MNAQSESDQLIKEAREAAKAGEKEKAQKILSQVVRKEPNNPTAWYLLGQIVEEKERKIYCYERVLQIEPENEKAQTRLQIITRSALPEKQSEKSTPTKTEQTKTVKPGYLIAFLIVLCFVCVAIIYTRSEDQSSPAADVTQIPTKIKQPIAQYTLLHTFEGDGKGTTDLFSLPSGTIRVKWNYVGESNFAFYLERLDNDISLLIENTIGNADGQSIMKVGRSDEYLFNVELADGRWKISIEVKN